MLGDVRVSKVEGSEAGCNEMETRGSGAVDFGRRLDEVGIDIGMGGMIVVDSGGDGASVVCGIGVSSGVGVFITGVGVSVGVSAGVILVKLPPPTRDVVLGRALVVVSMIAFNPSAAVEEPFGEAPPFADVPDCAIATWLAN